VGSRDDYCELCGGELVVVATVGTEDGGNGGGDDAGGGDREGFDRARVLSSTEFADADPEEVKSEDVLAAVLEGETKESGNGERRHLADRLGFAQAVVDQINRAILCAAPYQACDYKFMLLTLNTTFGQAKNMVSANVAGDVASMRGVSGVLLHAVPFTAHTEHRETEFARLSKADYLAKFGQSCPTPLLGVPPQRVVHGLLHKGGSNYKRLALTTVMGAASQVGCMTQQAAYMRAELMVSVQTFATQSSSYQTGVNVKTGDALTLVNRAVESLESGGNGLMDPSLGPSNPLFAVTCSRFDDAIKLLFASRFILYADFKEQKVLYHSLRCLLYVVDSLIPALSYDCHTCATNEMRTAFPREVKDCINNGLVFQYARSDVNQEAIHVEHGAGIPNQAFGGREGPYRALAFAMVRVVLTFSLLEKHKGRDSYAEAKKASRRKQRRQRQSFEKMSGRVPVAGAGLTLDDFTPSDPLFPDSALPQSPPPPDHEEILTESIIEVFSDQGHHGEPGAGDGGNDDDDDGGIGDIAAVLKALRLEVDEKEEGGGSGPANEGVGGDNQQEVEEDSDDEEERGEDSPANEGGGGDNQQEVEEDSDDECPDGGDDPTLEAGRRLFGKSTGKAPPSMKISVSRVRLAGGRWVIFNAPVWR